MYRLEALRSTGLVERVAKGAWCVPIDLPQRARRHNTQRMADGNVTLHSHLPIKQQVRVIGATWSDRQLIGGGKELGDRGFEAAR